MPPSTTADKMKATANAFINGFAGDWNLESAMKYRAPGCKHTILPASFGVPTRNNEGWAAYFKTVLPLVKDCKMTISDHIIDVEASGVFWQRVCVFLDAG